MASTRNPHVDRSHTKPSPLQDTWIEPNESKVLERDVRLTNTFARGFVNELGADLNRIGSNLHGLMRMASSSLKDMQGNSNKKHGSDNRKHKDEEIKIVMVHENDVSKGACDFDSFFGRTPQGLIDQGIYKEIAIALHTPPHRTVSLALVAQALGATKDAARQAARQGNTSRTTFSSASSASSTGGGTTTSHNIELVVSLPQAAGLV